MGVDVHILIPGLCDTDQGSVTQTRESVTQTKECVTHIMNVEGDQAN